MIPLRDENPSRTVPGITIAIIVFNAAVFLYEVSLGDALELFVSRYAVVPARLFGAGFPADLTTLVTSMFMHGSIGHIAGNMIFLWIFGNNVEDVFGHGRFLVFYLVCGILATVGYVFIARGSTVPLLGASGAISGVLGAYALLFPGARVYVLIPLFLFWRVVVMRAAWFLGLWFLFQFIYATASVVAFDAGKSGGVAWFAHFIGFIAGIVLMPFFRIGRWEHEA